MGARLLLGRVELAAIFLTFFQRARGYLPIETAPAFRHALLLMGLRFFLCGVTLAAFRHTICPGRLKNFPIKATPPTSFTIPNGFFFGSETLAAAFAAILSIRTDNLSVDAAPVTRLAILNCVFRARVTLAAPRLTIRRRSNVNYSVDTAVTPLRREAVVVAATTIRAR